MAQQPTHPPAQSGGTGSTADTPLFEKTIFCPNFKFSRQALIAVLFS